MCADGVPELGRLGQEPSSAPPAKPTFTAELIFRNQGVGTEEP